MERKGERVQSVRNREREDSVPWGPLRGTCAAAVAEAEAVAAGPSTTSLGPHVILEPLRTFFPVENKTLST